MNPSPPPPSPVYREDYNRLYGFVTDKNIRVKNSKGKVQLLPYRGRKMTVLGVLCCVALPCYLISLASSFLLHLSLNMLFFLIISQCCLLRITLQSLSCFYLLHSFEFQFHYGHL